MNENRMKMLRPRMETAQKIVEEALLNVEDGKVDILNVQIAEEEAKKMQEEFQKFLNSEEIIKLNPEIIPQTILEAPYRLFRDIYFTLKIL